MVVTNRIIFPGLRRGPGVESGLFSIRCITVSCQVPVAVGGGVFVLLVIVLVAYICWWVHVTSPPPLAPSPQHHTFQHDFTTSTAPPTGSPPPPSPFDRFFILNLPSTGSVVSVLYSSGHRSPTYSVLLRIALM